MPEAPLLSSLFGDAVVFREGRVRAVHGDPSRLPDALRHPVLQQAEQLAHAYKGPLSFGRGLRSPRTFDLQADAAGLLELGLTVFFHDLSATLPGASALLRQLERELEVPAGSARLSAFASAEDDGVSCHYDAEEVISIQLSGSKRFFTAPMTEIEAPYGAQYGPGMPALENLYPQAADGFPSPDRVDWHVTDMRPGSVLFLPRGTWHRTEATQPSLSLSIVVRPPVLLEALWNWLQPCLLGNSLWRRPLYGVPAREDLQPLLQALSERLQGATSEVLAWHEGGAAHSQRWLVVPTSRLASLMGDTPERLRVQVRAMDQRWQHRQTLDTQVPKHLAGTLEWIGQHRGAFDIDGLRGASADLPETDLLQLLGLLCQAHYLRRIPSDGNTGIHH